MRMSCVDPPGGVQLQHSNVKAGFDTVDNGDSNIFGFLYEITQGKCGDTGNRAMSRGGKKEHYLVDILHTISKHPIAGVTNSFKAQLDF